MAGAFFRDRGSDAVRTDRGSVVLRTDRGSNALRTNREAGWKEMAEAWERNGGVRDRCAAETRRNFLPEAHEFFYRSVRLSSVPHCGKLFLSKKNGRICFMKKNTIAAVRRWL